MNSYKEVFAACMVFVTHCSLLINDEFMETEFASYFGRVLFIYFGRYSPIKKLIEMNSSS